MRDRDLGVRGTWRVIEDMALMSQAETRRQLCPQPKGLPERVR